MTQDLARLAVEPDLGATVMNAIAAGEQLVNICLATGLGKAALLKWLEETPERSEAFARARASAAHALATEAIEIADAADEENPVSIQKAKLRTQVRQWTAERWNRKDYGQAKAEVSISLAGLHFEALRSRTVDMGQAEVVQVEAITPPTQEELDAL